MKPKFKDIMTKEEIETLYKYELSKERINTEKTPCYDSLDEYEEMLKNMGIQIKED